MALNLGHTKMDDDARETWRRKLEAYRTVLFHMSYGFPFALMTLFDQLKMLDLSPLLSLYMTPPRVAAAGTLISVIALLLHFYSDTRHGTMRDCPRPDGSCEREH